MANKVNKRVDLNKAENPIEKAGMLGEEEGFTTVKELLWRYGNKCLGIAPKLEHKKNKKV